MHLVSVRTWPAIGVLLLILVCPSISFAAGLAFSFDTTQTERLDGRFLYEYRLENAPGDNLPILSVCMEVGKGAALDEITAPPGWEISYETDYETAESLCMFGSYDFAWIPPGESGNFSFVSPMGTTAENYLAVTGLSYDYEESDGFEGVIATPNSISSQPGDANGDGKVDIADLNAVRNNFGLSGDGVVGDTNDDGTVDIGDLNAVRNNFGATAGSAAVPEPGTATMACGLLATVVVVLFSRTRRQFPIHVRRWHLAVLFITVCSVCAANAHAVSFTPLGHPEGGGAFSWAWDVSLDGEVVVGVGAKEDGNFSPFRWTRNEGMTLLDLGRDGQLEDSARFVSDDGSVILGPDFRWTAATGVQPLADVVGQAGLTARGLSGNGATIVGAGENLRGFAWHGDAPSNKLTFLPEGHRVDSTSHDGSFLAGTTFSEPPPFHVFRWSADGVETIDIRTIGAGASSSRNGNSISADGSTIVGSGRVIGQSNIWRPFRWTVNGTAELLSPPPGVFAQVSLAEGISTDGRRIVGHAGYNACYWDIDRPRLLSDVLTSRGVDLTGWHLLELLGISPDGLFAVGRADNPAGEQEAFLVELPGFSTAGDANDDGVVDITDLNLVRNNFGLTGDGVAGDTNDDSSVDIGDLNAVRNNFGTTAGAAAVPEPTTALTMLVACSACTLAYLHRHRKQRAE